MGRINLWPRSTTRYRGIKRRRSKEIKGKKLRRKSKAKAESEGKAVRIMPVYIPIPPKVVVRSVMTEKQVREILARADRNGDGCLTMSELQKALKEMGSHLPTYRAYRCLQIADFNHDGKISGKAEIDKLVAYILCWYHQNY